MSDASDKTDAITIVTSLVQPDVAPVLTEDEIEAEVDRAKLASTWAVNTAYVAGNVVVVGNGHAYEVVQPGTSQSTVLTANDWPVYSGAMVGDGNSNPQLTWREIGTAAFNPQIAGAEFNVYDIQRAARECWKLKARKASALPDYDEMTLSQLRKHCLQEANTFHAFRRPISLVRC